MRGYLTVTGLAAKLEVSRDWIYGRLASGVIDSAYVLRRSEGEGMLIKDDHELIAALQSLKKDYWRSCKTVEIGSVFPRPDTRIP